jgi:hypothetical protein
MARMRVVRIEDLDREWANDRRAEMLARSNDPTTDALRVALLDGATTAADLGDYSENLR